MSRRSAPRRAGRRDRRARAAHRLVVSPAARRRGELLERAAIRSRARSRIVHPVVVHAGQQLAVARRRAASSTRPAVEERGELAHVDPSRRRRARRSRASRRGGRAAVAERARAARVSAARRLVRALSSSTSGQNRAASSPRACGPGCSGQPARAAPRAAARPRRRERAAVALERQAAGEADAEHRAQRYAPHPARARSFHAAPNGAQNGRRGDSRAMTVLRIRDVRLLVGAVGLSALGDFLLWIPLALHVAATAARRSPCPAFFLALFGPVVALGGVAGRLADRFENAPAAVGRRRSRRRPSSPRMALDRGLARRDARAQRAARRRHTRSRSRPSSRSIPAAAGEERVAEANGQVETARYAGMTGGPAAGRPARRRRAARGRAAGRRRHVRSPSRGAGPLHARPPRTRAPPRGRGRRAAARATASRTCAPTASLRVTLAGAVAALVFFSMSIAAEVFFVTDVLRRRRGRRTAR